jgi:8-amino-7-oxononanoate synthase
MNLIDRWRRELDRLKQDGRHRALQVPAGIDFSSNDYLGYSKRSLPAASASDRGSQCDLSRSGAASRLLRGQHPIWDEVETKLAAWHHAEAALMMTSGYAANEGLLSTVLSPGDTVFSDQCNHASIIDGLRLSKAEKIVFSHNDLNEIESLMRQGRPNRAAQQAWFIVTESLFGMEGDTAPLRELAALALRHGAHLVVDEAHATGCFGPTGSGLVDALGLRDQVLATVHTGGKALAVPGAYIVGSRLLKDLLVNRCRHFIFTTALPPQVGAWWLDALELVSRDETARSVLHERARIFRAEMLARRIAVGGTHYIASIVLGPDSVAVEAARHLQEAGFDVRAIRPPTVAEGTARLRVSVHSNHDPAVLRRLADVLGSLVSAVG